MMRHTPIANRCVLMLVGLALSVGAGAARADVVAVVSAKNPVTSLTRNQIVDIFLGRASQFPDGRPAVPIDQDEGSTSRDEFYARFADHSPARLKAHWSKIIFTGRGQPPRQAANSNEVRTIVGANPNAVGYIERNEIDNTVKVLLAK